MKLPAARAAGRLASRAPLPRVLRCATASTRHATTIDVVSTAPTAPTAPTVLTAPTASTAEVATTTLPLRGYRPLVLRPASRPFSTHRTLHSDKASIHEDGRDAAVRSSAESAPPSSSSSTSSAAAASDLPWYLKVDAPRHATLVPQDVVLPEIPAGAPALMPALLAFVAEDMGLDDLALLDLRALDPPAALGPDLLMLFGTARSERHLHVSADRLVRWLRRHGVNAAADGLLGRNELKIKLRRKARKAKLLGGLGTLTPDGETIDDGISTQWVCLRAAVTTTGRAADEGRRVDATGRTSGFGAAARSTGTTLVVQMFTDAKRQQMDLETLWSRALARSLKARAADGEDVAAVWDDAALDAMTPVAAAAAATAAEADDWHASSFPATPTASSAAVPSSIPAVGGSAQQRRSFSTSARRSAGVANDDVIARLAQPMLRPEDLPEIERRLATSPRAKTRLLHQMTLYFDGLPRSAALEALGSTADVTQPSRTPLSDSDPAITTPFVRTALYCMDGLLPPDTWAFRAWMHASALRLGHPAYTLAGLGELVQEMQQSGIAMTREQCLHLLQGVLWGTGAAAEVEQDVLTRQTALALSLLETLHERGQAVVATDVVVAMVVALAQYHMPADATAGGLSTDAASETRAGIVSNADMSIGPDDSAATVHPGSVDALQTTLETLLRQARLPCPHDAQMMQLLGAYARQNDWTRFWATWRLPPQHGLPRSAALYTFMYRCLANTRHQVRCIDALRLCFQEMLHEPVPVMPVGAVREAMYACIRVADPQAERIARNLRSISASDVEAQQRANREFVRMLRAMEEI